MPEHLPDVLSTVSVEIPGPTIYEQKLAVSREGLSRLFDAAEASQESPLERLLKDLDTAESQRYVFGEQEVEAVIAKLHAITWHDKDSFIAAVLVAVDPLLQRLSTDPDVLKRSKEVEANEHIERISLEHLDVIIRPSDWNIALDEMPMIERGQLIADISWPDDRPGPKGIHTLKTEFQKICDLLRQNEAIKGVIMTSWMMSHPLTERLGFQAAPVELDEEQTEGSFSRGLAGRKGKPYDWQINREDVKLGVMSREEFLRRFA